MTTQINHWSAVHVHLLALLAAAASLDLCQSSASLVLIFSLYTCTELDSCHNSASPENIAQLQTDRATDIMMVRISFFSYHYLSVLQ